MKRILSLSLLLAVTAQTLAAPFAYIGNFQSNTVSVIDLATNNVVDTLTVGHQPEGVAVSPDGSQIFVSSPCSGLKRIMP